MITVTGYTLEWLDPNGIWEVVDDVQGKPIWWHEKTRWTMYWSPAIAAVSVAWYATPWDGHDAPSAPWNSFAGMEAENQPAVIDNVGVNIGINDFAIQPKVFFAGYANQTDFWTELSSPREQMIARIKSIEWETHPGSDGGTLAPDGPVDYKFYPDATTEAGSMRQEVDVRIEVEPEMAGIPVVFKWFDVDDPSDHNGPIDYDPIIVPGAWPSELSGDNFGSGGASLSGPTTSDAYGEIVRTFTVSAVNPGNNFRVVAAGRTEYTARVRPRATDGYSEVFYDENNNGTQGYTEPILWAGASQESCVATPRLTVWRTLHVEVDSMGIAAGAPFPNDDLLVGDVPNPDTGGLSGAFDDAFISVDVGTSYDNSATPFQHSFPSQTALHEYAIAQRGTVNESAAYWTVYVLGVYEFYSDPATTDNDEDNEGAALGTTQMGFEPEWSAIPMEVFRDVSVQWSWSGTVTDHVERVTVVHEIGHQFGLRDDYPGFPGHVM